MNKIVAILLLAILLLPVAGCTYDEGITQKQVDSSITTAINNQVMPKITEAKTAADAAKTAADAKTTQAYVDAKIAALPQSANVSAQITTLENKVTTLETKIAALEAKIGTTSSIPTGGTVTYTIANPQPYYQFSSSGNFPLQIKVLNNKPDSRYVRLTLTLSTLNAQSAGAATATVTQLSNSTGQSAVTFTNTATPAAAVNTILCIATAGGVNSSGEYLVASGTSMDIYLTITVSGGTTQLWNATISGSDRVIQ